MLHQTCHLKLSFFTVLNYAKVLSRNAERSNKTRGESRYCIQISPTLIRNQFWILIALVELAIYQRHHAIKCTANETRNKTYFRTQSSITRYVDNEKLTCKQKQDWTWSVDVIFQNYFEKVRGNEFEKEFIRNYSKYSKWIFWIFKIFGAGQSFEMSLLE